MNWLVSGGRVGIHQTYLLLNLVVLYGEIVCFIIIYLFFVLGNFVFGHILFNLLGELLWIYIRHMRNYWVFGLNGVLSRIFFNFELLFHWLLRFLDPYIMRQCVDGYLRHMDLQARIGSEILMFKIRF